MNCHLPVSYRSLVDVVAPLGAISYFFSSIFLNKVLLLKNIRASRFVTWINSVLLGSLWVMEDYSNFSWYSIDKLSFPPSLIFSYLPISSFVSQIIKQLCSSSYSFLFLDPPSLASWRRQFPLRILSIQFVFLCRTLFRSVLFSPMS